VGKGHWNSRVYHDHRFATSLARRQGGAKDICPTRHPLDIHAAISLSACDMEICRREGTLSRVDVIIPCYNYGRFLDQCVNSVLGQEGVDVRILVIDDASTDDTGQASAALALENPRVTVIRHTTNKGHINTYNEGIEWASADYMLLLSADDYLLPGALSRAAELMDAHPEVSFTFGNAIELSDSGNETPTKSIIEPTNGSDKRILEGREFIELSGADNLVATCSAVVRTELQKRLGGYRHELPHTGDMEIWLRFAAHASVGFISAYQGVYRQHGANMSTAYYFISDGRVIYTKNGRLADVQQRKSALDCFSEYCHDVMARCERPCRRLYLRLSELAVGRASAAFNDGEMEESRELSDFALAVCPEIRSSSAWIKLTCKRWMGARTWRAVRPAAAAIRAVTAQLRMNKFPRKTQ
jgi:glycosyltransferase involved in cell wall biosynthesis